MKLIKAVDVSSHNPQTLASLDSWIEDGCQLLMIHSYHREESQGLRQTTRNWINLANQRTCWALPYSWLFRDGDTVNEIGDSIQLFRDVGEDPKIIGFDCETYPAGDPGPTAEQILRGAEKARSMGVEPILYSNKYWLDNISGNKEILRGVPAWIANWNNQQNLNIPAPDWVTILAHQYTDTPVDWNVFDYDSLLALIQVPNPCKNYIDGIKLALTYKTMPKAAKKILTQLVGS